MEVAIKIKNVSVTLGGRVQALQDFSAELPKGKIIGFIGPSGAGKTTLMRSIVGRQRLGSGSISVFDTPTGSPDLRSRLSYMTQELSVYPDLSVSENLSYFATMFGIRKKETRAVIVRILDMLELKPQAYRLIRSLSSGQKSRVSLGIALIGSPQLMVLDEPTVGLDPVLREQIWTVLRELAGQGTTIIISSHVMEEAERCDELLLIRAGRLMAHGSPAELTRHNHTDTIEQAFLKLVGGTK